MLEQANKLRLCTLEGAIYIGASDVQLRGMVLIDIRSPFKQRLPVLLIHDPAKNILHMLSLGSQLSFQPFLRCKLRFIRIKGTKRVPCSVPEQLLDIDQLLSNYICYQEHQ